MSVSHTLSSVGLDLPAVTEHVGAMTHNDTKWNTKTPFALPNLPRTIGEEGSDDVAGPAVGPPRLTPRQMTAVTLLAVGHPTVAVARRIGVGRSTLFRWRVYNPVFAAELHRRQRDVFDVLANRVRLVAVKAVRVVDHELSRKRLGIERSAAPFALDVLRATGVMRQIEPGGSEMVAAVADQQVRDARGPYRADEEVTDFDREEVIGPWLADPEGEVEEVTEQGTTPREAYERFERATREAGNEGG